MKNLNACLASLNLGLPDDVRRLKEAGYYTEAIARIDAYLAEDWTKTQNQPVQPGGPLPENPTPHGVAVSCETSEFDSANTALYNEKIRAGRMPGAAGGSTAGDFFGLEERQA